MSSIAAIHAREYVIYTQIYMYAVYVCVVLFSRVRVVLSALQNHASMYIFGRMLEATEVDLYVY